MKLVLMAAAMSLAFAGGASAQSCTAESNSKKLAGAAKTSFMTKCESDAKAKCEADSNAKKLAGAARTSHMSKCVKDAVGG